MTERSVTIRSAAGPHTFGRYSATCDCGWVRRSADLAILAILANQHRGDHLLSDALEARR